MNRLVTKGVPARLVEYLKSAAHEMDDFKLIAVMETRIRPVLTRDDIAIQFDGYAICLDSKQLDESSNSRR